MVLQKKAMLTVKKQKAHIGLVLGMSLHVLFLMKCLLNLVVLW